MSRKSLETDKKLFYNKHNTTSLFLIPIEKGQLQDTFSIHRERVNIDILRVTGQCSGIHFVYIDPFGHMYEMFFNR